MNADEVDDGAEIEVRRCDKPITVVWITKKPETQQMLCNDGHCTKIFLV